MMAFSQWSIELGSVPTLVNEESSISHVPTSFIVIQVALSDCQCEIGRAFIATQLSARRRSRQRRQAPRTNRLRLVVNVSLQSQH